MDVSLRSSKILLREDRSRLGLVFRVEWDSIGWSKVLPIKMELLKVDSPLIAPEKSSRINWNLSFYIRFENQEKGA